MSRTAAIAEAFIARRLPKADWTHEAHLRVGLWHRLQMPAEATLTALRDRIRRYNEATGVANTPTSGYHETMTRFYVIVIDRFVASADVSRELDDLADALIAQWGDRTLPLRYYSRERLFSAEARRGWIDPDVAPIDL